MAVSCLYPDCILTVFWPYPDCILIVSWLYPDCFLTVSWLCPDCIMTVSWLYPDCILTVSWLCPDCILNMISYCKRWLLNRSKSTVVGMWTQTVRPQRSDSKYWVVGSAIIGLPDRKIGSSILGPHTKCTCHNRFKIVLNKYSMFVETTRVHCSGHTRCSLTIYSQ